MCVCVCVCVCVVCLVITLEKIMPVFEILKKINTSHVTMISLSHEITLQYEYSSNLTCLLAPLRLLHVRIILKKVLNFI